MRRSIAALGSGMVLSCLLTACADPVSAPFTPDAATEQLVTQTQTALESYWSGQLATFSSAPFEAPTRIVFYDDEHEPVVEGCALAPGDWKGNSFYCPGDGVLYLNPDLFAALADQLKTPALGGVVVHAHEFGHHLAEVDGASFVTPTIGGELQSDCYAGVFLSAVQDGDVALPALGDFDLYDAMQTIRRLGTEGVDWDEHLTWFAEGAHGGPAERAYAMALGVISKDPRLCQAYELTAPIDTISVGAFRFTPPPATTDTVFGQVHLMRSQAFPDLMLTVSPRQVRPGPAGPALDALVPAYFGGVPAQRIGAVEDFVTMDGLASASQRYQQDTAAGPRHGVLVLATRGTGASIVLDFSAAGPSPADEGWEDLGDAAFASLWGVYFDG